MLRWFRKRVACSHVWVAERAWNMHSETATAQVRCADCNEWTLVGFPKKGNLGLVDRAAMAEEAVRKFGT